MGVDAVMETEEDVHFTSAGAAGKICPYRLFSRIFRLTISEGGIMSHQIACRIQVDRVNLPP